MQLAQIQAARDEAVTFEHKATEFLRKWTFAEESLQRIAEMNLLRSESLKMTKALSEMRRA